MRTTMWFGAALLVTVGGVACTDSTTGRLGLALTTVRPLPPALAASAPGSPAGAPQVTVANDSTIITLGNDTIILRSVEVVLQKIELKRVEAVECDSVMGNDDCEEFETGPVLAALPLGATATETMVTVSAPPGQYDELKFQIHRPEASNDAAFIAAHPAFDGVSIRVTGTYSQAGTRSNFTFTSDLDVGQETFLSPPLTVSEGSGTSVTLRLDVASWFLNEAGTALVDPASANKGQTNESVVKNHIQTAIQAFQDNDGDGHDDVNEGT